MGRVFRIIILSLILFSCSKEKKEILKANSRGEKGDQTMMGTKLNAYDSTVLLWTLTTDKMYRKNDNPNITVTPVKLLLFDRDSNITTTVIADSGKTTKEMDNFYVWGSVYVNTSDGSTIRSHSLAWDKKRRELHSDDFVEIKSADGQKMRGKGFDSAEDFSWWNFYEDVSGNFPGFEESLGIDRDSSSNE